jgi:peptide-methionine (R)-S-oxide reductase
VSSPAPPNGEPTRTYRCRACGHELFDLAAQFEFGTGAWPNFTEPLSERAIVIRDRAPAALGGHEVRCGGCDSHLGQLFGDGPGRGAERYCIEWATVLLSATLGPQS